MGVSLLQESVMTYVYGLLAAQAVNPGKSIVRNNGVALMIQKSFVEEIEDRIRADNGVDNILELYERTLKHSTATGTIQVHERVTKIPTNLNMVGVLLQNSTTYNCIQPCAFCMQFQS